MFGFIQRQKKYSAVRTYGWERVDSARWFLQQMQKANDKKTVGKYWGQGSDLIFYQKDNITDRAVQSALNDIAQRMVEKCNSVGIYPNIHLPPFELG